MDNCTNEKSNRLQNEIFLLDKFENNNRALLNNILMKLDPRCDCTAENRRLLAVRYFTSGKNFPGSVICISDNELIGEDKA